MSKRFSSWLMSVGLLLCVVAGVGYVASPVTLPGPFGIDVLLAAGMAAGAFALGASIDLLLFHLGKSLDRRRANRRGRAKLRQLQADSAASEKRLASRLARAAEDQARAGKARAAAPETGPTGHTDAPGASAR
jgi:hypothetical protein